MLEDTVYCSARNIANYGAWNPSGGSNDYLRFMNSVYSEDLVCTNLTDQFTVGNNKAKLTYPVSILGHKEAYMSSLYLRATGDNWWTISPYYFNSYNSSIYMYYVDANGDYKNGGGYVGYDYGIRFVITLKHGVVIASGNGSETSPFVVQE